MLKKYVKKQGATFMTGQGHKEHSLTHIRTRVNSCFGRHFHKQLAPVIFNVLIGK